MKLTLFHIYNICKFTKKNIKYEYNRFKNCL